MVSKATLDEIVRMIQAATGIPMEEMIDWEAIAKDPESRAAFREAIRHDSRTCPLCGN